MHLFTVIVLSLWLVSVGSQNLRGTCESNGGEEEERRSLSDIENIQAKTWNWNYHGPKLQGNSWNWNSPSPKPTQTLKPSYKPTVWNNPSTKPTVRNNPSTKPTVWNNPTTPHPSSRKPSHEPTRKPTASKPSPRPSFKPTGSKPHKSVQPSVEPSAQPSRQPSAQPSAQPSRQPSGQPSSHPSAQPSAAPSSETTHPKPKPGPPTFNPTFNPTSPGTILCSITTGDNTVNGACTQSCGVNDCEISCTAVNLKYCSPSQCSNQGGTDFCSDIGRDYPTVICRTPGCKCCTCKEQIC